jgi:hypothetical protein
MAQTRSRTQLPSPEITSGAAGGDAGSQAFQRGLQVGREFAQTAVRRIGAWAEEHPGQVVLGGLAVGYVLGKLLLGRPRVVIEEKE